MTATKLLHDLGQGLWLDHITRDLLNNGTLMEANLKSFPQRPAWKSLTSWWAGRRFSMPDRAWRQL